MNVSTKLAPFNFPIVPVVALSSVAIAGVIIFFKSATIIPAGHVGVVDNLGQVSKTTLQPGFSFVNPFASIRKFSTRTKEMKQKLDSSSKEGLILNLEVSILYHVDPQKAEELYKTVGSDYEQVLIVPLMRSIIRQVTASYDAQALYTSQRQQLSEQIHQLLTQQLSPRGIVIEETPLRKLELPETLRKAVEEKLKIEQESQGMKFTLEKERQEAERKRIEAQGVADSQKIISAGLNDKLLQLRQIEASEKIAASDNAKVVIMGNTNKSSPLNIQP